MVMMDNTPQGEEPGFDHDVDELPKDRDKGSPETLEENPQVTEAEEEEDNLEVQRKAAAERKEGGYQ
jgi:hypothetical protein